MGYSEKVVCQICGNTFYRINHHVKNVHHTTITDLEIEGKWKNETIHESDLN